MSHFKKVRCVVCHRKIFVDEVVPTNEDKYYVVGAGHLYPDCYNEIYSQKDNLDIHI